MPVRVAMALGERRGVRHFRAPVQPIAEQQLLARFGLFQRIPEQHDVVERLVNGRDFHELHGALAPAAVQARFRFDPQARPPIVVDAVILVMIEIPVPLQQAEAARVVVEIRVQMQLRGIGERPPNPLSRSGPHRNSVRIMDLRPPIVGRASIVLPIEEHAGERCDTQPLDGLARIQRRIDVHDLGAARRQLKAKRAGDAGRVEQRVESQRSRILRRALEPKGGEARKFLGARESRYRRRARAPRGRTGACRRRRRENSWRRGTPPRRLSSRSRTAREIRQIPRDPSSIGDRRRSCPTRTSPGRREFRGTWPSITSYRCTGSVKLRPTWKNCSRNGSPASPHSA